MTTDNTLYALPAASTRLLLINSRLVYNSLKHISFPAYTSLFNRLAVLQLLQIITELMSAEQYIKASLIYPLVTKLVTHELAECADDLPTITDFKPDLRAALYDALHLARPTPLRTRS